MIDAINKENIDDGGKKVEPHKEKENNKVIGEKILDEFSLRQLRKMMKEKLQIANNKNSEEDNDTKVLYFFKYRVFPFSVFFLVLYFSSIFKQVNNHSWGISLVK
jgi:ATP-dependent Zn protease